MSADPDQLVTRNARWLHEQEHELWPDKSLSEFGHKDCRVCGPGPLRRGEVPSAFAHVFYTLKKFRDDYGFAYQKRQRCTPENAKVVSSEIEGTRDSHTIMLDIDMPACLIESSTPGHFHLYIDRQLPWRKYKRLLRSLKQAGVIEPGFYKASVQRRATHLRPPWKDKADD